MKDENGASSASSDAAQNGLQATHAAELSEFRAVAAMVMLKCGPTVRHWNDEHTTVAHPLTALVEMASMALTRWPE